MGREFINPEPLQAIFNTIEAKRDLLSTITDLHKTLNQHFVALQQILSDKSQGIDSEIKEFCRNTKHKLQELRDREDALPDLEVSLARRVEEQKARALEGIGGVDGETSSAELLRAYYRRMDSGGLVRLLLANRKESIAYRAEMAAAAEEAVDPARFVLDAVEEFLTMKAEGKTGLSDWRWACAILVQSLLPLSHEVGGVGRSLKDRALCVLERWSGTLGVEGSGGVGANEAIMFLHVVIGFRLKDKFDNKFLRKLVMAFAYRKEMPRIAVDLGFADIMGEIIDELVKSGKEIEAVYFAHESKLAEQSSLVTLLRSCLRNCRKTANDILKSGDFSAAAMDKANMMELEKTKSVIKCVEDHNLESQFPIDGLKKRVTQLEKAKADRKKNPQPSVPKPPKKRRHGGSSGRSGGPSSFRPPKVGRLSNPAPYHQGTPQMPPGRVDRFSPQYNYLSHNVYEIPGTASYGQGYVGAHGQRPVGLAHAYPSYPPQDAGSGSYVGQASYDSYTYSAAPPAYPPQ